MMKSLLRFLTIFALLWVGVSSRGSDVIPKRPDFSQYLGMLEHSPFSVATAAALPAATPNFAKDLYIANAARSSEGDMLTLASLSDRNFKEYLTTKAPNEHGYAIASIEWSDRVGGTKATISKDGQFATIGFNQALVTAPVPASPVQPPVSYHPPTPYNPTGRPPAATPIVRPFVPTLSTPRPHVRGVIPRNPNATAPPPMVAPRPKQSVNEAEEE
jgi:hypothetical protein